MKYLLDTNVLIWFLEDHKMLPPKIKSLIKNNNKNNYISIVTLWEIVMKLCKSKYEWDYNLDDILCILESNDIKILPLKLEHLKINTTLPMLHKDPFDRILISTAIHENLNFITSDKENHLYKNVKAIW